MNNIMIDLEMLGTEADAVILAIGAVKYDDTGIGGRFYRVIDIQSSLDAGRKISPRTLIWWHEKSHELQAENFDPPHAVTFREAMTEFAAFFDHEDYRVWGNGASFDNAIASHAFANVGISLPWRFWNGRCFRTMKNIFDQVEKPAPIGEGHHALYDATNQAQHHIEIMKYRSTHNV